MGDDRSKYKITDNIKSGLRRKLLPVAIHFSFQDDLPICIHMREWLQVLAKLNGLSSLFYTFDSNGTPPLLE